MKREMLMQMAGCAGDQILRQFGSFTEEEKHDLLLRLLQKTEIWQLRRLYSRIGELLAFDLVSPLPPELGEKVFSYLDAPSLCVAAQCCHRWRELANSDTLWYRLCLQKDYVKFASLSKPEWTEDNRPTSPRYKCPSLSPHASTLNPPLSHWRQVYMQAHVLARHWQLGVYRVAPLLKGHRQSVTSISCEDDLLVSGSGDNTARIWSLQSLECLHVLESHTDDVNCVVIKDGLIVTGSSDSLVRVFDSRTGQCLKSLHGHKGSVEHIAFDGKTILSGGADCSVRIWGVNKGNLLHTLTGHTEEIECLQLCGSVAVSGSWDCTLRIWDVQNGICRRVLQGHTEVVCCCECIGWRVVSGGGDGVIKIWDLDSGNVTVTLSGHTQEVLCLQCDDDLISSGSADSTIRIWNYAGVCLHVLEGHIGIVRCLHLQGRRLISGGDRKRVVVWNAKTGEQLHTVHRQQALLHRMCVTDTKIITASPDAPGTISVINYW